jgi:hypothetical protein
MHEVTARLVQPSSFPSFLHRKSIVAQAKLLPLWIVLVLSNMFLKLSNDIRIVPLLKEITKICQ